MKACVVALLGAVLLAPSAAAQDYPSKPLQFIVPFSAGSSPDVMTRIITEDLARELGQTIVVENRVGAGGNIAADYASRQPGDGYTVFVGTTGNMAVAKSLVPTLSYDSEKAFTPVSIGWITWNLLIVPADSKLNSVPDVIKEAKANPGRLNYGSPGIGTAGHLAGEWFKKLTGTEIAHVPYRGQIQVVQDLLAGTIQLSFETIGSAIPVIKNNQVKALAVTSKARLPQLPDVPTFTEMGVIGLDLSGWGMFVVPAATPPEVVRKLNAGLVKSMSKPAVRDRIDALGVKTTPSSPEEARAMLTEEVAKWRQIVQAANVRLDN
ncbi:MAG TPA: tripartite tricarboxylate transporter substrate binding protein [Xanthobacteraceae bacterium]|jgi:tripartite-type tricarboxylate transporter receptor subunit TctC